MDAQFEVKKTKVELNGDAVPHSGLKSDVAKSLHNKIDNPKTGLTHPDFSQSMVFETIKQEDFKVLKKDSKGTIQWMLGSVPMNKSDDWDIKADKWFKAAMKVMSLDKSKTEFRNHRQFIDLSGR